MNYFNYFTEIEEHFQRKRGAQIFVSTLDWALIESWREAGIPLAAVIAGIDTAFEKFESGRRRDTARLRSLLYCAAAVSEAAAVMQAAAVGAESAAPMPPSPESDAFSRERIRAHLQSGMELLPAELGATQEIRASLEGLLAAPELPPLDHLDRILTVLDDKVFLALHAVTPVDAMVAVRAELDRDLAPYRRSLRAEQLALIERQFLQRRLLERAGMKRLSLFYML